MFLRRLFFSLALAAAATAYPSRIIINEVYRIDPGSLSVTSNATEWVELVILQDMSAAELETYYFGDSLATCDVKYSAFKFTGMSAISPTFKAGTIILACGSKYLPTEDLSYNGTTDKVIKLQVAGPHLVKQGTGNADVSSPDVIWVDTTFGDSTISSNGFALAVGSANGALYKNASIATVYAPLSGGALYLTSDFSNATQADSWVRTSSPTPGAPNGGANTVAIQTLPVCVSSLSLE